MPNFMREGGIGMWFILLFGAITFVTAVLFARRPAPARLRTLGALTLTTLLSSLTAFTAGLAKSFGSLTRIPPAMHDSWYFYAAKGFSESCANLIFGFTLLTLSWMVIAIGLRRLAAAEGAAASGPASHPSRPA
jgi:hypothetical protein